MKNTLGIIPSPRELDRSLALAEEYGAFLEYNDFFLPALLDDPEGLEARIALYQQKRGTHRGDTLHGAFFDMNLASDDPLILWACQERARSSLEIARRLGVRGVVFHTNYIANFRAPFYVNNWISRTIEAYTGLAEAYPDLEFYLENMFDDRVEPILQVAEGMREVKNFGICLDYAHARVFAGGGPDWLQALAPYIRHIHINDNLGWNDDHYALGKGTVDWKAFRRAMEATSLNRPEVSVLLEVGTLERTEESLRFWKALWA